MDRAIDTFFYGLFMDEALLREQGHHPTATRRASLAGWALRIGDRATLVPDPTGCVHGVVMALPRTELDRLYAAPSVSAYRPEAVLVTLADGSRAAALCFNLPAAPDGAQRNPAYAAKLRAVAQRLGLPAAYVDSIR